MTLTRYHEIMDRIKTDDAMRRRVLARVNSAVSSDQRRTAGIPLRRYVAIAACAAVLILGTATVRVYIRPDAVVTSPAPPAASPVPPASSPSLAADTPVRSQPPASPAPRTEPPASPPPVSSTPEATVPPQESTAPDVPEGPEPAADTPAPDAESLPEPPAPAQPDADTPPPSPPPVESDAPAPDGEDPPPLGEDEPISDDIALTPSDIQEVSSVEELSRQVGFPVRDLPVAQQAGETVYLSNFGMAEIIYRMEDQTVTYRKSEGEGDNSGNYTPYSVTSTVPLHDAEVTLKGEDDGVYLAFWSDGGYAQSIQTTSPVSQEEMTAMVESAYDVP